MNQRINKNMFSFEKFFALCNEAANFSKFTYKLFDREEYLKNPSVVTALTKLSSSGGLKIFSLPYVFSFEGELNARGFKISDIYAVEKNSSKLKHLVMPTASGVKESSKGINIWFPISKSSATDIPYKAAEIDALLINNGSETMGKYKGPMTPPTDIALIKDLDINIIDLDYTGPVSNAHYKAIQAGHDLLQDHGLLFVTFQASHFRHLSSEMRAQFDNYSKAYASDEYKSLIPSAAETRGFGVKERESYEKYASNITKEIAEKVKGLKPIYINPYLGGEGTSKSSTMIRLIFVKDASNTFATNSSIEIPQALEELKFMPLTSSRLDIHDLATMLVSDKNLLDNFCNLFKTVYDEAKNQTGEPDKSKLNAAKKAHVTSAIVKNAIRDFDDGNELYAQILYHNLGGENVGYFINDDPRILLESLNIICREILNIYSEKVTSEEAFLKLYNTVNGKITDIEKYKKQLEQKRQKLAAKKGKTHASRKDTNLDTSISPTTSNFLAYSKPGDYFENLKNKLTRTKVTDDSPTATGNRASSDLSVLQHSLAFGRNTGELSESDYARWATKRLIVKLKSYNFTEEQLEAEKKYLKEHGNEILSKVREEKEKKYEEKSGDTILGIMTRLFQGKVDKIVFNKPVALGSVSAYFNNANQSAKDYVREIVKDERGREVVLSIRRKDEDEMALKDVPQRAKNLKIGETIELKKPINYYTLEKNINKLYKDENIEYPMKLFSFTFADDAVEDVRKREITTIKRERNRYLKNAEIKRLFDSLKKDEIKDVREYGLTLAGLITTIKTYRHGDPRKWAMASAGADGKVLKIAKMGDGLAENPQDLKLILPHVNTAKANHFSITISGIISRLKPGQEHEFGKPVTRIGVMQQIRGMHLSPEHYEFTQSPGDKISKIKRKTSEEIDAEAKENKTQKEMMRDLIASLKAFERIIDIPSQMKMAKTGRPITEICNTYDLYFTKQDQYGRKMRYSISTMYDVYRDRDNNIRQLRLRDTPSRSGSYVNEKTSVRAGEHLSGRSFNEIYNILLMEL